MVTQNSQKSPSTRWVKLRELAPSALFLIIAIIAECLIVIYAAGVVVKDSSLLQWSFQFPGTTWNITLAFSPLFHLVPIAAVISLMTSWMYLKRHMVFSPQEIWRGKAGQTGRRGRPESKTNRALRRFLGRLGSGLSRAARSALVVFVLFMLFMIMAILLAYPQAIYRAVASAYQANPSLLGFFRATGQALAFLGVIGNAFLFAVSGFRDLALGFGSLIGPLAKLDNAGKYLVIQNAATWLSTFTALFYVEFIQKSRPYRKK